jgi:N-acetylglucosaminyl-diphospho-decaprenol L-rhamnosyltransferase
MTVRTSMAKARQSSICIVIVNYRTAQLVNECLASVEQEIAGDDRAIVIDNDSGDRSVESVQAEIVHKRWGRWASIIGQKRNGGFAYGNNIGIQHALRAEPPVDYVLLLNPDTIVRPGAIAALRDFLDAHPSVGVAGSLLEDRAGRLVPSAHNAHSPVGELLAGARFAWLDRLLNRYVVTPPLGLQPRKCDWVSGASFMVRREVFESVGLLDEGYFLYFEEADFCARARLAGWQVWCVPHARVLHLEGAATGIREVRKRRARYWYESRRRYFVKHFGVAGLMLADVLWAAGRMSLALRRLLGLARSIHEDPKWFALDLLWGDVRWMVKRDTRVHP